MRPTARSMRSSWWAGWTGPRCAHRSNERFDVSRMVDEYVEVYRRIVDRDRVRGR